MRKNGAFEFWWQNEKSFCALEHLEEAPAFVLRERARFHDYDFIAWLAGIFFVVRHEFARAFDEFAIDRVAEHLLDFHRDRLSHFVGDDNAGLCLPKIPFHCFGHRF